MTCAWCGGKGGHMDTPCEGCNRVACTNEICQQGGYPHYGIAPHRHMATAQGKAYVLNTVIDDKKDWPDNFIPDPEADGQCGMWLCPDCGSK